MVEATIVRMLKARAPLTAAAAPKRVSLRLWVACALLVGDHVTLHHHVTVGQHAVLVGRGPAKPSRQGCTSHRAVAAGLGVLDLGLDGFSA